MTRACRAPVRAAVGEAFTEDQIDEILERLAERHRRAKGEAPGADDAEAWEAAARDMTIEEVRAALLARRLQAAAEAARKARRERLDGLPGDEADRLRAYNVGTERQGLFASASVDAEGRARAVALWSQVERGLARHEGLAERLVTRWTGRSNLDFDLKVRREMHRLNGGESAPTGDPDALAAAEVFVQALEASRAMQNREGAWIGRIKGYMGRQNHDRLRVAGGFWRELKHLGEAGGARDWSAARLAASRRAFREWRDFIRPRLAAETFRGLELDLTPVWRPDDDQHLGVLLRQKRALEDARALQQAGVIDRAEDLQERFLYRVWSDIVAGRHEVLEGASDLGEFRPPAGKARAVSRSRVLHFAGPEAAQEYAERFGAPGGLYGAIMRDLDRAGRNAALMARWGPSPEAAWKNEVDRLKSAAIGRGDTGAAVKLDSRMRRAEFDELTGATSAPENLRLAIIGRSIRVWEGLSKLGGMVLSALADGSLASQSIVRAGGNYLDGYGAALRGVTRLQGETGKAVADALDVGARSAAAHLSARFAAADGFSGWASYAQRLFYKVNGFEFWADGIRAGTAEMLASIWGRQADRAWGALEVATRETFERYGLDEGAWELLRRGAQAAEDGRSYLTAEAVDGIDDAALLRWPGKVPDGEAPAGAVEAAREDLRLRFQTMVTGILDDALTEARARERVGLHRGLKAGTIMGEAIRTFTQFWSFSQAVIGRHLAPAARGYGGQSPVSLLAHLVVATMALGYLSVQAKQLVKGREPRPLFDEDGEFQGREVVIASLLQGGGLGIYGDFLFGEANRNGLGATLSAFAGPAVGDAERLYQIVNKAVWGDPNERDDVPGELLRWGQGMTPFANLWYSRLALDYLVMWRLQEAVSPGYLERHEKRVERNQGQGYWLSPSEAVGG